MSILYTVWEIHQEMDEWGLVGLGMEKKGKIDWGKRLKRAKRDQEGEEIEKGGRKGRPYGFISSLFLQFRQCIG
ncbi:MAG TPA: hypothetical protein VHR47_04175 [Bacillota bacterium]|nr:hypothetical protein [Bacillota bacterium]